MTDRPRLENCTTIELDLTAQGLEHTRQRVEPQAVDYHPGPKTLRNALFLALDLLKSKSQASRWHQDTTIDVIWVNDEFLDVLFRGLGINRINHPFIARA